MVASNDLRGFDGFGDARSRVRGLLGDAEELLLEIAMEANRAAALFLEALGGGFGVPGDSGSRALPVSVCEGIVIQDQNE